MSLDHAKAFIEKMKSDKAFSDVIMAIEDIDARLAAASDAGFEFTENELKLLQSQLTDDELDGVSGGDADARCYTKDLSGRCYAKGPSYAIYPYGIPDRSAQVSMACI